VTVTATPDTSHERPHKIPATELLKNPRRAKLTQPPQSRAFYPLQGARQARSADYFVAFRIDRFGVASHPFRLVAPHGNPRNSALPDLHDMGTPGADGKTTIHYALAVQPHGTLLDHAHTFGIAAHEAGLAKQRGDG